MCVQLVLILVDEVTAERIYHVLNGFVQKHLMPQIMSDSDTWKACPIMMHLSV